jgi:hypothetical protein
MAKHKTVTHLPSPSLPSTPAPRLAAQLFVALGELVAVGLCAVGLVTVVSLLIAGPDARHKATRQPSPPREIWRCWYDRRYGGEICDPPYRLPPLRHYWARDDI